MWESERASEDMADARKRIAELDAECNACAQHFARVLADNVALREALEVFGSGSVIETLDQGDYSILRERIIDWFGRLDFVKAKNALTTPATAEALERVRNLAKAEVWENLAFVASTEKENRIAYIGEEYCLRQAAALRGGQ